MKDINLVDFREIILSLDMKYLRFVEKKSNKMYLIEDYIKLPLEEKIEKLKSFNTMEEVENYFIGIDKNTNIFSFIYAQDIKYHLNTITSMNVIDKKKLTAIIKEVKNLNIKYINFTYFFVETGDGRLYFSTLNKNTNEACLKNLKIEKIIKPADISVIMRDIKAYGAFKYHDLTIKYSDIKKYIENPLLSIDNDIAYIVKKIRDEESKNRVNQIVKKPPIVKTEDKDRQAILKKVPPKEKDDTIKKTIPKEKDDMIKQILPKEKKNFKDSFLMYCLIGFSAGVVLAAITIVIGSFV